MSQLVKLQNLSFHVDWWLFGVVPKFYGKSKSPQNGQVCEVTNAKGLLLSNTMYPIIIYNFFIGWNIVYKPCCLSHNLSISKLLSCYQDSSYPLWETEVKEDFQMFLENSHSMFLCCIAPKILWLLLQWLKPFWKLLWCYSLNPKVFW